MHVPSTPPTIVSVVIGITTAAIAAAFQVPATAPLSPLTMIVPSLIGLAGAAVSWGAMKARLDAVEKRIDEEKGDRVKAIDDLKREVNERFDKVDRTLGKIFDLVNNRPASMRTRQSDLK